MDQEKKVYISPESEWIFFGEEDDVITTSGVDEGEWDIQ